MCKFKVSYTNKLFNGCVRVIKTHYKFGFIDSSDKGYHNNESGIFTLNEVKRCIEYYIKKWGKQTTFIVESVIED